MPKQQITIEVYVPEGYEATGEYRTPTKGDEFICSDGTLMGPIEDTNISASRIILRKKWTPPSWMPEGAWLFWCDGSQRWWMSIAEPFPSGTRFAVMAGDYLLDVVNFAKSYNYPIFEEPPVKKIQIHHSK